MVAGSGRAVGPGIARVVGQESPSDRAGRLLCSGSRRPMLEPAGRVSTQDERVQAAIEWAARAITGQGWTAGMPRGPAARASPVPPTRTDPAPGGPSRSWAPWPGSQPGGAHRWCVRPSTRGWCSWSPAIQQSPITRWGRATPGPAHRGSSPAFRRAMSPMCSRPGGAGRARPRPRPHLAHAFTWVMDTAIVQTGAPTWRPAAPARCPSDQLGGEGQD
jgi:hypothetical protein